MKKYLSVLHKKLLHILAWLKDAYDKIKTIANNIKNIKLTVEEYAEHKKVSVTTVYLWIKRGMETACQGKGKTLRINLFKADAWVYEYKTGKKTPFKALLSGCLKALKKHILPIILGGLLLITIIIILLTYPRLVSDNNRLVQENVVLATRSTEQQTALSSYAQMQEKYSILSEISEAIGIDISSALDKLKKHGIETPELTIAASLDIYEYLGEWIASEAQSDKQKLNELFEQIEAVPDTWPVVSSYVFEDRRLTENKPVGVISSGFGWRKRIFQIKNLISRNGVLYEFHTGIDIRSSLRTPVVASAPGEVIATEWVKGYGNLVIIDHGYNYETYYAHLSEFKIQPGDKVERGQLIGLMGESGRATGPHLHFEIRLKDVPMNPYGFIKLKE